MRFIYDEYKKFKNYVHELNYELWKKATDSEEPDEKMYFEIKQVLEKESAAYCKTHRIFDEREIKQGQIVLPIHVLEADVDEVATIIENAGYSLAFYSLDDYNCMKEIKLKRI